MRVLAIGECMAELAPAAVQGDYHLGFAGDTFNTAWYLARLRPDMHVSFFTAVGADDISLRMRDAFLASGIGDTFVQTVAGSTVGLYMISLINGERSFSYWRGQSAARQLAADPKALAQAMSDVDLVYFSGITLAILDAASREVLLTALRTARAAGKTIAFDPNLRPHLWSGPSEMTEAIMQGAAVSDIALPSFEDEAAWFHDADPMATADRYAAAGATTVVVKNGADAVHHRQGAACDTVSVPPLTHVIDTTAAGDSFNAAILAGLQDNMPLKDSITLACRLAGTVVQGKGALVPIDPAHFDL
jgi:2-dehydro-3-deoxygluconokinase